MAVTLDDLQGAYDISYQTTPQLENFYEPGFGAAKIEGNRLRGMDGLGVIWDATFEIQEDGSLSFKARLDPKDAPPTAGLMNEHGQMSREPQDYNGVLQPTQVDNILILRTRVQQGPLTIDVQFRKKT